MAGLCEGGNKPPGSLKAMYDFGIDDSDEFGADDNEDFEADESEEFGICEDKDFWMGENEDFGMDEDENFGLGPGRFGESNARPAEERARGKAGVRRGEGKLRDAGRCAGEKGRRPTAAEVEKRLETDCCRNFEDRRFEKWNLSNCGSVQAEATRPEVSGSKFSELDLKVFGSKCSKLYLEGLGFDKPKLE
ncbi:hypothetical protein ANN_02930 [Periplaneta americana]|uniref:Uncharacterized protein n=1 Tax=Periplaneta americana TaxID=6978 RepID=A0ABQ8TXT8_PERAM|nr:hypothetical protein ANN_02930 [Periplaneta americana]